MEEDATASSKSDTENIKRSDRPKKSKNSSSEQSDFQDQDIKAKQDEALKQKQLMEKKRAGYDAVKRTIHASIDDNCDWRVHPIAVLKGDLCGSHYKVLGINRHKDPSDKASIKRAYRQMSLSVHPDKNPSEESETAFQIVQDAYECLSNEECKENYDLALTDAERRIALRREELKEKVLEKAINGLNRVYYHVSIASNQIYHIGMNVWDWAGELTYTFAGGDLPVGRFLLIALGAATRIGQGTAFIFAMASMIVRWNIELAKNRGYF